MRVLLTGGTGFVGSHVARLLVQRGHDVHALVLDDDREEQLAKDRWGNESEKSIKRVRGDLLQPSSYAAALTSLKPEAAVHLGWYANPKDYLSSRINIDLLAASASLGAKLVDLGCRRIVAAGTCFEYDVSLGVLSETSHLSPRHLYSTCKRALYDVMTHLVHGTTTSFAWTRLFFLYGPHESKGRLVPAVIDALLAGEEARVTTGEQFRDFMHVADAAAGIVHVLENESISGPVNVASGEPVRVRDVVRTIARILNTPDDSPRIAWGAIQARAEDPQFVCANVTKLASSGFRSSFDLEAGLRNTIEWTKATKATASRA